MQVIRFWIDLISIIPVLNQKNHQGKNRCMQKKLLQIQKFTFAEFFFTERIRVKYKGTLRALSQQFITVNGDINYVLLRKIKSSEEKR